MNNPFFEEPYCKLHKRRNGFCLYFIDHSTFKNGNMLANANQTLGTKFIFLKPLHESTRIFCMTF